MEAESSNIEERDLRGLLESFGSAFALEDIINAYCDEKQDVNLAAEILCASNDVATSDPVPKSSDVAVKSEFCSASMGTVSGVVGRDYIQPKTWTKPNREVRKPLKLDAKELPESVIWGEKSLPTPAVAKGTVSDEIVNFLFIDAWRRI